MIDQYDRVQWINVQIYQQHRAGRRSNQHELSLNHIGVYLDCSIPCHESATIVVTPVGMMIPRKSTGKEERTREWNRISMEGEEEVELDDKDDDEDEGEEEDFTSLVILLQESKHSLSLQTFTITINIPTHHQQYESICQFQASQQKGVQKGWEEKGSTIQSNNTGKRIFCLFMTPWQPWLISCFVPHSWLYE